MLQSLAKVGVGLTVLILGVVVGAQWLIAPETAASGMGITLEGPVAFNQVRGDIGGVFLGLAVVCLLGLVRREPRFLEAGAIALAGVIAGRLVGVVANGFAPEIGMSIAFEVVFVASLLATAKALRA